MDHPDLVNALNSAPLAQAPAKDPVCGMNVTPETAHYKAQHDGKEYFFCSAGCLAKFQADPEKILSSPPKHMAMKMPSGLVSLGASMRSPNTSSAKVIVPSIARNNSKDEAAYVCPMCPEVRESTSVPAPNVAWH